jgi:hypothetical protein
MQKYILQNVTVPGPSSGELRSWLNQQSLLHFDKLTLFSLEPVSAAKA